MPIEPPVATTPVGAAGGVVSTAGRVALTTVLAADALPDLSTATSW